MKEYNEQLWVDYHGKIDRIADGSASGQIKNWDALIKQIQKDTLRQLLLNIKRFDDKEKGVDYFAGWDNCLDTIIIDCKKIWKIDLIN